MDYTWDGIKGGGTSPYEKGKYMPILRNHRYIFTIKEVKGPGFATLNEAVTSPDNFTNHNIVVVPIVIDAFTDITFNESGHFLAVTRTAMTLQGKHDATSTQNKFSVRTNYPSGWKVGPYNADGTTISVSNSWLKPSQNSGRLAPLSPIRLRRNCRPSRMARDSRMVICRYGLDDFILKSILSRSVRLWIMLPNITSPVALSIILLSFLPFLRVFLPLQPRLTLIFIGLRAIAMTNLVIIIGTCSQERIMILTIQMPRSSLMMSF